MDTPPEPQYSLYLERKITSATLAALMGVHPVTIRRNIKRTPRVKAVTKSELIKLRNAYRATQAHLPASLLQDVLCVSKSTAHRIKQKYKNGA